MTCISFRYVFKKGRNNLYGIHYGIGSQVDPRKFSSRLGCSGINAIFSFQTFIYLQLSTLAVWCLILLNLHHGHLNTHQFNISTPKPPFLRVFIMCNSYFDCHKIILRL